MNEHLIMPLLFPVLLAFLGLIWGGLLWRFPSLYNPQSFVYRQVYLWYAAWFRKKVDESYTLADYEVIQAGRLIAAISGATLMLVLLILYL